VFGSWNVVASENTPALLQEGPLADDPLLLGNVIDAAELFSKDRMETEAVEAVENDEEINECETTSNFSKYKEDF
jgi:hypothetical protein